MLIIINTSFNIIIRSNKIQQLIFQLINKIIYWKINFKEIKFKFNKIYYNNNPKYKTLINLIVKNNKALNKHNICNKI